MSWRVLDCFEYPCHVGAEVESRSHRSSLIVANLGDLRWHLALARHVGAVHKQGDDADVVMAAQMKGVE